VPGREPNVTEAAAACGSYFNFPEALPDDDLGRSSMRRRLSLMFFCFTVGKPMFMFVVYTSRVIGNALLAPNELSKERLESMPCVAAKFVGGEVVRAAAVAGRGRFMF
jgi:hypothetical protein